MLNQAELTRTKEWKWVAAAAVEPKDPGRIALHHVLVEPHAIVASNGHILRLAHLNTGAEQNTTIAASPRHRQSDNVIWPEYRRLFPEDPVGTCYIDDAAAIVAFVGRIVDMMDETERRRTRAYRPVPIVLIERMDHEPAVNGRHPIRMVGGLSGPGAGGKDRPADQRIVATFPGRYDAKLARSFRWAVNGLYLVDALKWADRFMFTDKHGPAEFGNGEARRAELIMPMMVNW